MHFGHVTHPPEAMLKYGILESEEKCPNEDLVDYGAVFLTDAKTELRLLEQLQLFDDPTIHNPSFRNVQKGGEYHSSEDQDFGSYGDRN